MRGSVWRQMSRGHPPSNAKMLQKGPKKRSIVMPQPSPWFTQTKSQIVHNLLTNTHDKSLAGHIDPRVAPLVHWINASLPCCVTSSSCSGRLLLFHRADVEGIARDKKRGSAGTGKVLESHDPIENVREAVQTAYLPALRSFCVAHTSPRKEGGSFELLHLQFRPMILHILVSHMEAATRLLECAGESGQNSSGILSCSRRVGGVHFSSSLETNAEHSTTLASLKSSDEALRGEEMTPRKITCCVSSSLAMDVPLLRTGSRWLLHLPPDDPSETTEKAWGAVLEQCLEHSNELFQENFSRMERFKEEIKRRLPISCQ